jgi:hypothetical protein
LSWHNGLTTVPTWVEIQQINSEMYQAAIQSRCGFPDDVLQGE